MKGIEQLAPGQLRRYSERTGEKRWRDVEYYHWKEYVAAGQTSLEFFRIDGAQLDVSGTINTVGNVTNMLTAGKMDEDFLITGISVGFLPKDATYDDRVEDVFEVYSTGRIVLEVNNTPVFERTPLGRCGSPTNFGGSLGIANADTTLGSISLALKPHKLDPPQLVEKGITLSATMYWSSVVAINYQSWVGVYLHGLKHFTI